ncbi:pre-toxin TG domain-containing protein [Pseudomonas fluorescens]|uniref:pre-toxin TG domain-containing protein n=1 Tax=Pseudomonas fluorescens TaxID=294 RepID=UPI0031BB2559
MNLSPFLSGALTGGDAFNAAVGAGTAKNAVENNHLSDIEKLSLTALQKEYDKSCQGSTSKDCQGLSDDIAALIVKDASVLKEEPIAEDGDFTRAYVWTTNPGDVVSCATSPNGYCVATDKSITTSQGEEWILQSASFEQATEGKARSDLAKATATGQLKGLSNELFSAGCGGAGLVGIGCQGYMAAGGENPVTGEIASNTERVMWGAQSLLNAWGLGSSIFSVGTQGRVALDEVAGTVDDTIKALPGPRQIDASWGVSTYKKGGLMTGIEHVFYRHGADSGFVGVSKFAEGTSLRDVSSYVDRALRYGKVTPNGPGGFIVEYDLGRVIGTNEMGVATTNIKINVRNGIINTAFPK